jgi:hypothetical protein
MKKCLPDYLEAEVRRPRVSMHLTLLSSNDSEVRSRSLAPMRRD